MTKFFEAGKIVSEDLSVLQRFSDFNEITQVIQNALRLLDAIEKYEQQILL